MSSAELEVLANIGKLRREPPSTRELEGLRKSAVMFLTDAAHAKLSFYTRFDLAYNAAHVLALYALRRRGYRSEKRYPVFQTLAYTVGLRPQTVRVLAKAQERHNAAEYGDLLEQDEPLMRELIDAAKQLRAIIEALPVA